MKDKDAILEQVEIVSNYMTSAYCQDDIAILASVKLIQMIATTQPLLPNYRASIDKIAIMNGITKA